MKRRSALLAERQGRVLRARDKHRRRRMRGPAVATIDDGSDVGVFQGVDCTVAKHRPYLRPMYYRADGSVNWPKVYRRARTRRRWRQEYELEPRILGIPPPEVTRAVLAALARD